MACVYIIEFNDPNYYYIGSTSNLKRRIREHRSKMNKLNTILYKYLRENDYKISMLINCEGLNFKERVELENHCIIEMQPLLNDTHSFKEERLQKVKQYRKLFYQTDIQKQKQKEYKEKNRGAISMREKAYREKQNNRKIKCECGAIVHYTGISRHKKTKYHQRILAE